ncbi:hypothetical protein BH10BDE1_BH10BDE1_01760 [soil metagenome]
MTVVHSVFKSVNSQATGVVFAGRNGLDFLELRLGAVRIPEVSLRIRDAQKILDALDVERVDLLGSTITEDESFFRNIKIKSLLAAIVQVGLYERLLKSQRAPEILIGNSNGDSPLLVCAGQMTFEDMVKNSAALQTLQPLPPREAADGALAPTSLLAAAPLGLLPGIQAPLTTLSQQAMPTLPSLSGLSLTEFRAFLRNDDGSMSEVGQPVMDLKKLLTEVVEHQTISRFINVGPGAAINSNDYEAIGEAAGADEVTVIDSIDLDPMLNWFWKQMRPSYGLAN